MQAERPGSYNCVPTIDACVPLPARRSMALRKLLAPLQETRLRARAFDLGLTTSATLAIAV